MIKLTGVDYIKKKDEQTSNNHKEERLPCLFSKNAK